MIISSLRIRGRLLIGSTAIVSIFALSACDESLVLTPGAIDSADNCGRFQQAIVNAREEANTLRVQNIAAGALAGALIGAALAGDGNREQGAIIGALLGGATAGAATANRQQTQRDADAQVLRDVNTKAGSANKLLTDAGRSAASLRSCRLDQISALEGRVKSDRVTRSAARAELQVLQRRASADNQIISASFNGIGNRVDDFVSIGARSSGVESAIIRREAAARTAEQRAAQSATPNVSRAKATQTQVVQADLRQQASIERRLSAIDVLLSG